uniref:Hes family bHLH transcription factor 6 n=1 Tax=Takifugu rubripes TaxID=31033 RepID=A0A3B5KJN4_TAKRU
MAPSARSSHTELDMDGDEFDFGRQKTDRKIRKPLVEKKRRARINESLRELRTLLADTDVSRTRTRRVTCPHRYAVPVVSDAPRPFRQIHSKMENAEVLEMTVKKVEDVLKDQTQETEALNREANERFAAGYIQCMHEVHMFVSSCPGIDATVAAELLNHLLECMPLNEDHLQDTLMDLIADTSGSDGSTWHGGGESLCVTLESPRGRSGLSAVLSPAPSTTSSEDLCSDLDDTDSEHNQSSTEGLEHREGLMTSSRSMWRPW